MSPRPFARWFAARPGTTPHQWLTSQRLMMAQELLERTDHGIEQVAADCGLAPMMLRRHFTRRWSVTPQACRPRADAAPPSLTPPLERPAAGLPAPVQPAGGLAAPR